MGLKLLIIANFILLQVLFSLALPTIKGYYDFCFQYCVFLVQRIQVCETKNGRPKKFAGNLSDPQKIAQASSSKFWYGSPPTSKSNINLLFTVFVNDLESDARVWFHLTGWRLLKDTATK